MIFSEDILLRVGGFVLGVCGFLVARHVFKHKNNNENPLVCPINFDCHGVVHSDYSKLFGIPVEILGMIYYAVISLAYLALIFVPETLPFGMVMTFRVLSLVAFLFSLYLIGVQLFVLRKGCSWCFVSAFISILIFAVSIMLSGLGSELHSILS